MLGIRGRDACALAAAAAMLVPVSAQAALPAVGSGERPGPPLLYAPAPDAPQLTVRAPFSAAPLLVSGTDAYRAGEYLYQDHLFDDRGADTSPGPGSRPTATDASFSPSAGDVQYPTAPRYAGNAADLVELRIKPLADAIAYRITLNTAIEPDAAVVGIGIDRDRSGGAEVDWPNAAGVSSPGLDAFITAWGTGGEVTSFPGGDTALPAGAVSMDTTTNQMTIRVPHSLVGDPGAATWRHVAGTGLWDAAAGSWKTPAAGTSPSAQVPASGSTMLPAPAVFNLAFRFDEPQIKQPGTTPPFPYTTFPGTGNWYEDKQAHQLAAVGGTSTAASAAAGGSDFHADVDFAKLAAQADEAIHASGPTQARIMPSALDLPEGVRESFPQYGGALQPYVVRVPSGLDPDEPVGLTFALHSLGATYTQFAVFSPNQLTELGDQRQNIVVTPLGHGPNGWYKDEGEADVFEVWADLDRHFNLDPDRAYVSGYSMGGYGSYKLGAQYPDLWARAFTVVGPPAEGVWIPPAPPGGGGAGAGGGPETLTHDLLENVRWVPYMNWVGAADELVPVAGPIAQQQRFDELGLRSSLFVFTPAEHFTLAAADEWDAGRDFLGDAEVTRDPSRVDYAFFPAADSPGLGLLHDHAYWVSDLVARDASSGPGARGAISARSMAHGEGDPLTAPDNGAGADAGPPIAYAKTGTRWTEIPPAPAENALQARLENLGFGAIDGPRAQLDGARELRVEIETDGPSTLRLNLPLPTGTTVVRLPEPRVTPASSEVSLDAGGATFTAPAAGSRAYLLRPPAGTAGDGVGNGAADNANGGGGSPGEGTRGQSPGSSNQRSGQGDAGAGAVAATARDPGGSLPFTGLTLIALLGAGLALTAAGLCLRSALRRPAGGPR